MTIHNDSGASVYEGVEESNEHFKVLWLYQEVDWLGNDVQCEQSSHKIIIQF